MFIVEKVEKYGFGLKLSGFVFKLKMRDFGDKLCRSQEWNRNGDLCFHCKAGYMTQKLRQRQFKTKNIYMKKC